MAYHGAKFLGESRLVHGGAALALDVGGHGDQCRHREHPRAAHAGDHRIPGSPQGRQGWLRQGIEQGIDIGDFHPGLFQAAAQHRDETGTKPLVTAVILVTGALVDLALAPQRGILGQHRQAIGFDAAIAAALAHRIVDKQAPCRVLRRALLPAPPQFRRAGLLVDDHRGTPVLPQFLLQGVQFIPVVQAVARHGIEPAPPAVGIVADQGDPAHALTAQLVDQVLHFQGAVDGLATGHGHRVVVENLVGDIDPGGHRGANGQDTRMEIGAVPQVLEYMRGVGKRCLPDPGRALPAHLGKRVGGPIRHPGGHVVAAYAAHGMAALRHPGRGVVRATRAEVRHTLNDIPGHGEGGFLALDPADALIHGV